MGTACAIVLAENPEQRVSLWARNADHASDMVKTRENKRLLPGITIPDSVEVTADIAAAVADSDLLVMAVPIAPPPMTVMRLDIACCPIRSQSGCPHR